MADRNEKIIFQLELDVNQLIAKTQAAKEKLAELKAEGNALSKSFDDLKKTGVTAGATFDNLNKQLIANKAAQQNTNREILSYETSLRLAVKANEAQIGSIDQLKARLSILTAEYNALSEADRESTANGKALAESIDLTTQQLNKQEQSVGNFRRQIGNYEIANKSLREQIKEAKDEATRLGQQFGFNSEQATKATQKVADLTEELGDFNKRVAALNPEQKFAAFAQLAGSVAGGISAAQGAMALFGTTSEATQEALLKVQAAMAFATGLNQLAELGDSLKNVKIALGITTAAKQADTVAQVENTTAVEAGAVATTEYAAAEEGAAVAAGELRVATTSMLGPIGLIAIAIGLVIESFELLAASKDNINSVVQSVDAENAAHKLTIDRLKEKNQEQITTAENALSLAQAEGASLQQIADLQNKVIQAKKDANTKELIENKAHLDELIQQNVNANEALRSDISGDDRKKAEEIEKTTRESIEQIKIRNAEILNEQKKFATDSEIVDIQLEEKRLQIQEKVATIRINLIKDERKREIAAVVESTNEQIRQLQKAGQENAGLIAAIKADENNKIKEINKKFDRERLSQIQQFNSESVQLEKERLDAIQKANEVDAGFDQTKILSLRLNAIHDNFNLEVKEIDSQKEIRITKIRQEVEDKKITVEDGENQIAEVEETADAKKLERLKASGEAVITTTQEFEQKKLQTIAENKQLELEAANPEDELQAKSDLLNAELALEIEKAQESLGNTQAFLDKKLLLEKKYAKLKDQLVDENEKKVVSSASSTLGNLKSVFKEGSQEYKAFATAQATVDTYAAAVSAYKAVVGVPVVGPALAIAASAAAVAAGFANIFRIQATPVSFEQGGYTGDGHPSQVSTTLGNKPYTYHKSEYVIPAPVLSRPDVSGFVRNFIEPIRLKNNPVSFSNGFASGGFADTISIIDRAENLGADAIRSVVEATAREVMKNLPPIVTVVQDVTEAQGIVTKTQNRANI